MNPQFMSSSNTGIATSSKATIRRTRRFSAFTVPSSSSVWDPLRRVCLELAHRQPLLREMFLDPSAQGRPDSLEVFASPHPGFEVCLGPRTSPGLHADRRTKNTRNLLGDRRDLLLDHTAGDIGTISHAHAPWGRRS